MLDVSLQPDNQELLKSYCILFTYCEPQQRTHNFVKFVQNVLKNF